MRMRKPSEKFPAIRRSRQSSNRLQAPGHCRRGETEQFKWFKLFKTFNPLPGSRCGGGIRRGIEQSEAVERLECLNAQGDYMRKTMALVAFSMLSVSSAFAQAPFYQGKTITIIHGRSAGDREITACVRWRRFYKNISQGIPPSCMTTWTVAAAARRPIISSTPLVPTV